MASHFIQPQLATRAATLKECIWMRIGDLQTLMNDRDRSLEAFERVLQVNPGNIHAMTQIGLVLAKKERYPQAVAYLQRAVAADASCGEAWSVLAHCYFMTDDLPKSYQAYQNALNHSQDPSPNLWYGIGQLYERYGSADHALETFLAVLRMAPNFERAIEVCFYIGTIYKEQRKFDEAIQYFEKISLAPNPPPPLTRADAWHHIGHVNELKADIPKALDMYKLALNENPHHAKTLQNLGWLEHFHKNNSREAIRRLQMSLEADQNDAQAWYLLGRVCMDLGEVQQAFDAYQQAIIRDGHNANFWCAIGVLYYQQNQYRDAMDAYTKSIHLNPSVSETWDDLATLYESQGQRQHAITAYTRAAELSPEKTHIRERLNALQNAVNNPHQPQNNNNQALPMPPQPGQHPHRGALPPVSGHSQPLRALHNPQSQAQSQPQAHQLQPLGLRPAGSHAMQQQSIPMLQQVPTTQQHAGTHQPLPRHIMQHPLQQPHTTAAQGSTGFNQGHPLSGPAPPQANHLRSTLPHLSAPVHGSRPNSQSQPQSHVPPLSGATQRAPNGPNGPPGNPPGANNSNIIHPPRPNNNSNNALLQPLPQLPGLQTTADTQTHPGSVKPGEAIPPLLKKMPGKDTSSGHLERIPSLQRPSIHPIPSLAPLVQNGNNNKQGGNTDGNSSSLGGRLPPTTLKTSPLPPLQKMQEHGGSTLPSVSAPMDVKHEGTEIEGRPDGTNSNSNSNEDAKLLQSMAEPKRSLLNTLPVPRSAPTPAPKLGALGSSSLSAFGNTSKITVPNTLPSPLAQPRKQNSINSMGLPTGSGALMASPTLNINKSASNEALPLPRPLTALPSLIGKSNSNEEGNGNNHPRSSADKLPSPPGSAGLKSPGAMADSEKKNPDTSNSSLNKPTFGIPRSVPIASITGMSDGNSNGNSNSKTMSDNDATNNTAGSKREVSPGAVDNDKSYKRPRVHEKENGDSANGEKKDDDNNGNNNSNRFAGIGPGPPLPIPNNAPLPSFRSSRMKMGTKGNNTTSPLLRTYAIPKSKPIIVDGDAKTKIDEKDASERNGNSNSEGNGTGNSNNNNRDTKTASESTGTAS